MNLQRAFGTKYSRSRVNSILHYLGDDPNRVDELINIYQRGPYRITQQASWVLSYCFEKHPDLARPHVSVLMTGLKGNSVPVAIKRNTIRMFQFIVIPKRYHGTLVNLCFQYLTNIGEAAAVKAFCLTVLARLIQHEPVLKRELLIVIEEQWPYSPPSFKVRARLALKMLDITSPLIT